MSPIRSRTVHVRVIRYTSASVWRKLLGSMVVAFHLLVYRASGRWFWLLSVLHLLACIRWPVRLGVSMCVCVCVCTCACMRVGVFGECFVCSSQNRSEILDVECVHLWLLYTCFCGRINSYTICSCCFCHSIDMSDKNKTAKLKPSKFLLSIWDSFTVLLLISDPLVVPYHPVGSIKRVQMKEIYSIRMRQLHSNSVLDTTFHPISEKKNNINSLAY